MGCVVIGRVRGLGRLEVLDSSRGIGGRLINPADHRVETNTCLGLDGTKSRPKQLVTKAVRSCICAKLWLILSAVG